jgi:hypothetical protein
LQCYLILQTYFEGEIVIQMVLNMILCLVCLLIYLFTDQNLHTYQRLSFGMWIIICMYPTRLEFMLRYRSPLQIVPMIIPEYALWVPPAQECIPCHCMYIQKSTVAYLKEQHLYSAEQRSILLWIHRVILGYMP